VLHSESGQQTDRVEDNNTKSRCGGRIDGVIATLQEGGALPSERRGIRGRGESGGSVKAKTRNGAVHRESQPLRQTSKRTPFSAHMFATLAYQSGLQVAS